MPRPTKPAALVLTLLLILAVVSPAQERSFSLGVMPALRLPLFAASDLLALGGAGRVDTRLRSASGRWYADLGLGYTRAAAADASDAAGDTAGAGATISTLDASLGAGIFLIAQPGFRVRAGGRIGYGSSTLDLGLDEEASARGGLGWAGVLGLGIPLGSSVTASLDASLQGHLNTYAGLDLSLGLRWVPGRRPPRGSSADAGGQQPRPEPLEETAEDAEDDGPAVADEEEPATESGQPITETVAYTAAELQLLETGLQRVFPVFYSYYDSNPVGSGVLRNASDGEISGIDVAINIPRYMDVAQRQDVPASLGPGEEARFNIQVLFNDGLLEVTEGTRVAAELRVSYRLDGEPREYLVDTAITVADRNAMTWDDDRKAASFVTAKDPEILAFAKNVGGIVRNSGYASINNELRIAMGMLEALALHGINYVVDPTTPYIELSEQPYAIDFLQFPRQTLQFRAGDCDDLSICYNSTLQAVGIRTAFITIPGHLFMAFATGLSEDELRGSFSRPEDFIVRDGEVWIPVETTVLQDGFLEAWEIGARQWREHEPRGQAELIPVEGAWELYEPVGFDVGDRGPIDTPDSATIRETYQEVIDSFVSREIRPQVARLESRIASSGGDPRFINRLGVLYARYEMTDEARTQFRRALEEEPQVGALVNLGNLEYLAENYQAALDYYEEARGLAPERREVLLGLARTQHELENYEPAGRAYAALEEVAPELASRFEYLAFRGDESARASDPAQLRGVVIWAEESE